MNRRSFLTRLAALGAGIVVVGPSVLAEVQRHLTPAEVPPSEDAFFREYIWWTIHRPPFVTPNYMVVGPKEYGALKQAGLL